MALTFAYTQSVKLNTVGIGIPDAGNRGTFLRAYASATLDLTGEKVALIGRVCLPAHTGTKTISSSGGKIHVYLGTTTWANAGTSMDVGIQDVTGPDADGTFDVKATLVPGTETLTGSAVNSIAMETGSKVLTHNQMIAVVFDMTARAGADSVIIRNYSTGGGAGSVYPYCRFHNATSWGVQNGGPNVLIETDDGTMGTIEPYPFIPDNTTTVSFDSGTATFDEYGSAFILPWEVAISGITIPVSPESTSSDFELCLYTDHLGTPTLVSGFPVTFDASFIASAAIADLWMTITFDGLTTLAKDTYYGWSVRPTTTSNVSIQHINYGTGNNALLAGLLCGSENFLIKRLNNTGAFTEVTDQHIPFCLHVAKFHDGSSSGGMLVHPGLNARLN